jgi:hypothetical protein
MWSKENFNTVFDENGNLNNWWLDEDWYTNNSGRSFFVRGKMNCSVILWIIYEE